MKTIFVSSTFKDMHYERDIIHEKVMPDLNEYAAEYGESVSFCDLRWGVNTSDLESEEGSRKVLSVCLDEIDRCRPYMIVILGERYGWIPEEQLIAETIQEKKDFALDELEKSVTALEIEYGALTQKEQLKRTLFYFREFEDENMPAIYQTEDEHHAGKLRALKERIVKLAGGQIKSYTVGWDRERECLTGVGHFAELVIRDIRELLEQEWQEYARLTPYEKDQRAHWDYAIQKAAQFGARESVVAEYEEKLKKGQRLLVLQGAAGSGKSTLMSRLAVKLSEEGYQVLPIFCGNTRMSDDTLDLIKGIVHYIEDVSCLPHFEEEMHPSKQPGEDTPDREDSDREDSDREGSGREESDRKDSDGKEGARNVRAWSDKMAERIAYYEAHAERTLVICVDAVDQLSADEAREKLMFLPTNLSEKVRMIVSCLDTFALPSISEIERVEPLKDADKRDVVEGITRFLGRELETCVVDRMIARKASESPLYLSLLIQRLMMMNKSDFDDITAHGDGMSAITAHQMRLVEQASDTLHGVCVDILETAAERIGGMMAEAAVRYLAVSRHGLRESDLEALLLTDGIAWNSLDFSLFIKYMRSFFICREDGRYDFTHKSIREGFLMECEDVRKFHGRLLAHFDSLDSRDAVRVQEIMYHCCHAGDRRYLVRYVNTYEGEEEIITPAAKDVYGFSMQDEGRMVCGILTGGAAYGAGHEFLQFINYELDWAFGVSQKELEVQEKIMAEAVSLAKCLETELGTAKARRDVTTCYYTLGDIYEIYGGREYLDRARSMYLEALQVREELDQEEQSLRSKSGLAFACYSVGYIYEKDAGQESLEKALAMYQRTRKLREELFQTEPTARRKAAVASVLADIGDVYRAFSSMDGLTSALSVYQRALEMRRQLVEESDTSKNRKKLHDVYRSIALVYETFGGQQNLDYALGFYKKILDERTRQAAEDKSIASRKNLADSYIDLGDIYDAYRTDENRQKSLAMYAEACKIRKQLVKELGTAESRKDLSIIYHRIADIYGQSEDQESLTQALALYQKTCDIQKRLAEEQKTTDSLRRLALTCAGMGNIYKSLDGQENLAQALAMYERARELQEQVIKRQQTVRSRESLVSFIIETGVLYEVMSGAENLKRAAEMFEKALHLQLEIVGELKTAESRHVLAILYYRISECYVQQGGREKLVLAAQSCVEAVKIWESLEEEQKTTESKGRLAFGYDMAGSVYRKLETPKDLERAIRMYEKEKELCEELMIRGAVQGKRQYAAVCNSLAGVYSECGGSKNLKKALELYQETCVLREQLSVETSIASEKEALADSYGRYAEVYIALRKQLGEAEELQKKALKLREDLDRELNTIRSKSSLAASYSGLSRVYLAYGDVEHLEQARKMQETSLALGRDIAAKLQSATGNAILVTHLENLGDVHRMLGRKENLRTALRMYEEGMELQQDIVSRFGTLESKRTLVGLLERVAVIHMELGSKEGLSKALELFLRGEDMVREMLLEDDSAKCRGWFAGFLQHIGEAYDSLYGEKELQRVLGKYEEALEAYRSIERELDTTKSREQLAYAYETTGNIYRRLGGEENRKKALECYEQNMRLADRLYEETDTADNKKRMAVAFEKLADVYMQYKDRDHFKQALELYLQEAAVWESLADRMNRREVLKGLAISQQRIAGVYRAFAGGLDDSDDKEASAQALELYEKAVGFWQQLYEETGQIKDQRDIGICYERMGDLCHQKEETSELLKALQYYEAAIEVGERLAEALGTFDMRKTLAIYYVKSANVASRLGGKEYIMHAAGRYGQAVNLREQLVEEDPGMVQALGECYRKLANVYQKLAARKDSEYSYAAAALVLYEKALSILEETVSEMEARSPKMGSEEKLYIYRQRMMETCANLGDLYLSQKQDMNNALEVYEKACRISRIFVEEKQDTEHMNYHAMCLVRLLQIYGALGSEEYLEKALEIGRESLRIHEALLEEDRNVQIWDNYVFVLYQMIIQKRVPVSEKAEYVEVMLSEARKLYETTGSPRHQNFVEIAEGLYKIIYREE